MKKILVLDGGGIRGYMTALFLGHLYSMMRKPYHEVFDLIIGNSTGGILALGLARGLVPDEIAELYLQHGAEIFKPRRPKLAWWRRDRYNPDALEKHLKAILGDFTRMEEAKTKAMVLSYDIQERSSHHFTSWAENRNEIMWRAARATSAAPAFFPPLDGRYIDGGLMQNNPTIKAFAKGNKLFPLEELIIVSVGTGEATRPLAHKDIKGLMKLAPKMSELFMDGQTDAAHEDASDMADANTYFRFQRKLLIASDDFDDVSSLNLSNLALEAEAMLQDNAERLIQVVKILEKKR